MVLLVEPFAGGASTSLRMVGEGIVNRILLADADPLIAAFWQVAASDTNRLIDRARDEWTRYVSHGGSTAVARWDYWKNWTPPTGATKRSARFDAAMQCLFLNRTTFSGILHGRAGPIGGRKQESQYNLGCRWNVDDIERRLRYIGSLYDAGRLVDVWCRDWRQTLDEVPERYSQLIPSRVVAYLDPPYVEKSATLYRKSFDPHGGYAAGPVDDLDWNEQWPHEKLAAYLTKKAQFRWLLSYDAHPMLTEHDMYYAAGRMSPSEEDKETLGIHSWRISKRLIGTKYSAYSRTGRRLADELLITTLPPSTVPQDDELRPL